MIMHTSLVGPLVAVALIVGPAAPASAQLLTPHEAVSRLVVGEQVRVQAPGTAVELGTVSEIDPGTLYVVESGQEWLIDIDTIERLEVRRRSVIKNMLIFGAVGALASVGAKEIREGTNTTPIWIGGFVFGAAFGYTQWQWRVTYPR
jgi:hypothetical protein